MPLTIYTSASILGPLLIFGGLGIFLDKTFNTKPVILIVSIIVAFIFTNIFLYKKVKFLINKINQQSALAKKSQKQALKNQAKAAKNNS